MPKRLQSIAPLKCIVLYTGGGLYVCEEYNEADNGRLHVMGDNRYGSFDRATMSLDYHKAALDVKAILYEAESWPEGVPRDRRSILIHLGLT